MDKMKPSITELKNKHKGVPIIVIGGGPTAMSDFLQIDGEAIIISANEHFYKLGGVPDYFCFLKSHNESINLMPYIKNPYGAVRICKVEDKYSDYTIDIPVAIRGFTGHFAVWLASYLTDSDVIICGIDCYSGKKPYYDERKMDEMMGGFPLDEHLRFWNICKNGHPTKQRQTFINPDRIYAVSGELTKVFKKWKKKQT